MPAGSWVSPCVPAKSGWGWRYGRASRIMHYKVEDLARGMRAKLDGEEEADRVSL
jgi:hypothetical protein